ncbi:MAG: protein kinase [Myxococcales bacterium]|nr:protein kinase [Myxococcales bacterium]
MTTPHPSRIGDRYEVTGPLGQGGVARVYRARDVHEPLAAEVAVKVLRGVEETGDPAGIARLAREIESLRAVRHPNVVALLDHGVDASLGPYVVMPLLEGTTVRQLLDREGALLPEVGWPIVTQIADALAAVHGHGWAHRDVKPENVMLAADGTITLLDFGLALAGNRSRHTTQGMIAGSIPYMAPEQIEGRDVGPACDVWSLGVLFWEILAGSRPHTRGGLQEEVAAILAGARPPAKKLGGRRIDGALAQLLEACLSLDPSARPTALSIGEAGRRATGADSKEALASELGLYLAAPAAYRTRTAARRAAELAATARRRLEAGDSFGALEAVEIGLAYKPEDAALLDLLSAAGSPRPTSAPQAPGPQAPAPAAATSAAATSAVATTPAPARRRLALPIALGAAALALGLGAFGYSTLGTRSNDARARSTSTDREEDPPKKPASATASSGGVSSAAPASGPALPFPEVPALALADLSNDDPARPKPKPKPGEPLFPPTMFEDPGPAGWLTNYEEALAKDPKDTSSHMGKALALLALNRTQDGLSYLDQIEKRFPDDPLVASTHGVVAGKQGDLERAEKLFSRAAQLEKDDATHLRNLGIIQSQRGKTRDAYVSLVAALQKDPDDLEALKELTAIYGRVNRTHDAAPLARRIAQKIPRDPDVWLDVSIAESDEDKSLEAIRRALALAPEMPRAHERLCIVLSKKKAAEAVGACARAIDLSGKKSEESFNARGLAHFAAGNDTLALQDIDEAIRLDPAHASYYKNRYIVRAHAGQLDAAKKDLAKACELGDQEACDEAAKQK